MLNLKDQPEYFEFREENQHVSHHSYFNIGSQEEEAASHLKDKARVQCDPKHFFKGEMLRQEWLAEVHVPIWEGQAEELRARPARNGKGKLTAFRSLYFCEHKTPVGPSHVKSSIHTWGEKAHLGRECPFGETV